MKRSLLALVFAGFALGPLASAQAAVETQTQEVNHLELQRVRHELRAPFAGRVGEIFFQPARNSAL